MDKEREEEECCCCYSRPMHFFSKERVFISGCLRRQRASSVTGKFDSNAKKMVKSPAWQRPACLILLGRRMDTFGKKDDGQLDEQKSIRIALFLPFFPVGDSIFLPIMFGQGNY